MLFITFQIITFYSYFEGSVFHFYPDSIVFDFTHPDVLHHRCIVFLTISFNHTGNDKASSTGTGLTGGYQVVTNISRKFLAILSFLNIYYISDRGTCVH